MSPVKKTPKKERPEAKEKPAEKPSTKSAGKPAGASRASGGAAAGFRGYLNETKLPVYSLMFVLPMVLFYEAAVVVVNRPIVATRGYEMRISADVLIRESMGRLLSAVGLGDFFMSGVLVAVVLVVWQIVSRKGWEVKAGTLLGMLAESLALAVLLVLAARFVVGPLLRMTIENDSAPWLYSSFFREIVFSFGAGIYEEFIFRLVLVWVFALIVAGLTPLNWDRSVVGAVVLSAIVFAAHHHLGLLGEPFTWPAFLFRVCSGMIFGAIYFFRGFGIAVGSHALYDILCYIIIPQTVIHGGV